MKEKFSLKDHLFNEKKVQYLTNLLKSADSSFEHTKFTKDILKTMFDLELKDRIKLIAEKLSVYLPKDFKTACKIIVKALPPPLDPTKSDNDFGDFILAPFGEFVARNGATTKNVKVALMALEEITQRFSMEDAIRTFLNQFPKETLAKCQSWLNHPNYHVRRLVSEGTRPYLPWSKRIPLTAADTIPLLDVLYRDKTRYVTRSVANHLNDISKQNPELVLKTLKRWHKEQKQDLAEITWMTKHALRTLSKRGDQDALLLLGYNTGHTLNVKSFALGSGSSSIKRGETLVLIMEIESIETSTVMIDYIIHFKKAKDKIAPKVFRWKKVTLSPNKILTLQKKHRLHDEATTFKLYPGSHKVTLQINGSQYNSLEFNVD